MLTETFTESDERLPVESMSLQCDDLDAAIVMFTRRLGFRLDMIVPADSPWAAILSGHGLNLRLEKSNAPVLMQANSALESNLRYAIFTQTGDQDAWVMGRAGMEYRDLIPGRLGGRIIASHIRLGKGGKIADYEHFHKVRFQMIFCRAGWVRVVYEDQGPPFVLNAGDCVLQPPEIRHRVLESSAGAEVIEIGCPAVHETWSEHNFTLPTACLRPNRDFNGQFFVRHIAGESVWMPCKNGLECQDTGIRSATNGYADVGVIRFPAKAAASGVISFQSDREFNFFFVLQGRVGIETADNRIFELKENDCFVDRSNTSCNIRIDQEFAALRVSI